MVAIKGSLLLAALGCFISKVAAHGVVTDITAAGVKYTGYNPHAWKKVPSPGWSIPLVQDFGFIMNPGYANPDIICHRSATPGALYVKVAAGDAIELQWTVWPEGHHGCFMSYLARCEGECTNADKTKLKFNKIEAECLIKPNPDVPIGKQKDSVTAGYWAGDKLRANGNKWIVKIPKYLKAGKYLLRHEALAYQRAMSKGPKSGLQHYPQCINLEVTGSGTDDLGNSGLLGTELYRLGQPGMFINIFANPASCPIPGPPLYKAGEMSPTPHTTSKGTTPSTTTSPAAAATTTAPPKDTSKPAKDSTVGQLLDVIEQSVISLRAKVGKGGNHARDLRNMKRFIS